MKSIKKKLRHLSTKKLPNIYMERYTLWLKETVKQATVNTEPSSLFTHYDGSHSSNQRTEKHQDVIKFRLTYTSTLQRSLKYNYRDFTTKYQPMGKFLKIFEIDSSLSLQKTKSNEETITTTIEK